MFGVSAVALSLIRVIVHPQPGLGMGYGAVLAVAAAVVVVVVTIGSMAVRQERRGASAPRTAPQVSVMSRSRLREW